MSHQIVILKAHKSVALALILTFLFGPVGLFYSTIVGGFIMMIVPTVFVIMLFKQYSLYEILLMFFSWVAIGNAIFFYVSYWIGCILWAIIGVNSYNEELDRQISISESEHRKEEIDREFRMQEMYLKTLPGKPFQLGEKAPESIHTRTSLSEWLRANPGRTVNDYFLIQTKNK
jgi:hypothetical protein